MKVGDAFLAVALLITTIPNGESDRGFCFGELRVIRVICCEGSFKHHRPTVVAPIAGPLDVLMGLRGQGAEAFSVQVFHRRVPEGVVG